MAETIGRAYIKILADGSGFPEDVRDEVRKAEPALRKEARRQGDAYADEFGKRMSQKDIGKDIRENLERSMARTDIARAYFGSRDWDRFLGRLKKEAGNAGVLAGHELEVEFRHNIEGLADAVGDMGPRFDRAAERLSEGARVATHDFEGLTHVLRETVGELDDLIDTEDDASESHDRHSRSLAGLRGWLERTSKSFDEIGDEVGDAFGKGSRNNFINFFGSLMGNLTRLPGALLGAGAKVIDFAEGMGDAFKDAGGGFSGFIAAAGKIAPAVGGAIVGFVLLVSVLGTVTSAFLLAAGAAAALVSTIAFGLVGAVAPLVGLLGPLSVVAGGLALAFIGMSDAAKKSVKEAFAPLKEELKALGDAARPGILDGLTAAAQNLEAPMKRLQPLFKVVGDSIGTFIDTVSKVSFGPGFEAFVATMTKTLPSTMKSLGTITGNVLDGLAGLFATLQPVTDVFLDSMERISGAFADWSISPEAGTFFQKAADSAGALLDFLGPVWNLTMEILDAGKGAGDSLFQSMGKTIQGWVDALKANPDILKNFFDDAQKMGEAIGNVVVQVGHLIDALDTPLHREWAIDLIKAIGDLIGLISKLVGAFDGLPGSLQAVALGVGVALTAFTKISGGLLTLGGNLKNAETRMGTLAGAARFAAGGAGLALLIDGLGRSETALGTFETIAGGAAVGFSMAGPWGAAIGGTVGGLAALVKSLQTSEDAVKKAGESATDSVSDWDGLTSSLNQVTGAATEVTRAFIFDKITKAEDGAKSTAEQFAKLGISTRTLIDAMMGSKPAVEQVETALRGLDTQIDSNKSQVELLDIAITNLSAAGPQNAARVQGLEDERDALKQTIAEQENMRESLDSEKTALEDSTKAVRDKAAAVTDWKDKLKGIPPSIVTLFEDENTLPKGVADVRRLVGQFKSLQSIKKVKTIFEALGIEISDKKIKRIIASAKEAGKQKPKIRVEADTKPFDTRVEHVRGIIERELPRKTAKPKADLDTSKFDTKNANVKAKLNEQDRKTATPKITVDNTQAMTAINAVQTGLNNLPTSKTITVHVNTVRTGGTPTASGGIFAGAQTRLIGEAGPEAVVPLNRPLSQIDPAVRELSAIAQGMRFAARQQRPVAQKIIDVGGIQIITPTKDPGAAAQELVNRLVAVGY